MTSNQAQHPIDHLDPIRATALSLFSGGRCLEVTPYWGAEQRGLFFMGVFLSGWIEYKRLRELSLEIIAKDAHDDDD